MSHTHKHKSGKENHAYPKRSAGRVMKTHVPIIKDTETLKQVDTLLHETLFATINYIYVVDNHQHFIGVISIKELFRHPGSTKVSEVMKTELLTVRAHSDQEHAAYLALHNNLKSIPILDKDNKLLGIIDSDTLLKIIEKETTEDTLRLTGIVTHTEYTDTMHLSLFTAILHRLPWLLLGLFGGIITAIVVSGFEEVLSRSLVLASFIPLIVYMAGAVESQLVVLLVRDYSRDPKLSIFKYFIKQLPVVLSIGTFSSILLYFISLLMGNNNKISGALAIALFVTVFSSIFTGVFIPALFKRLRIDPANASGPIASTLQDLMSISLYLSIASWVLTIA